MRQVPTYLIIGNGRVARHFAYYFSCLNIQFETWTRHNSESDLKAKLKRNIYVFLLISDDQIEEYIRSRLADVTNVLIHFSGALYTPLAIGCHPLMTFGPELYTLEEYQRIPFVIDDAAPSWAELFPQLPNPHVRLKSSLKAKYHAMCVLAGNFTCLLWQQLYKSFEQEFGMDRTIAYPYLQKQFHNLMQGQNVLTGPLARGDKTTLTKNLAALQGDPYQQVYQAFILAYEGCK